MSGDERDLLKLHLRPEDLGWCPCPLGADVSERALVALEFLHPSVFSAKPKHISPFAAGACLTGKQYSIDHMRQLHSPLARLSGGFL